MSAVPAVGIAVSPEHLAGEIDWEFQHLADTVPAGLQRAYLGQTEVLYQHPEIGKVEATFLGKVAARNFAIRVLAEVPVQGGTVGFYKDYDIDYFGKLIDTQPASAADFEDCPIALCELSGLLGKLHDEYLNSRIAKELSSENVVSLFAPNPTA